MALNHFDNAGQAIMVDVSGKPTTVRIATVQAWVRMAPATLAVIEEGRAGKGDVLNVARLAGISAAKKTPDLIPLSHPLALHAVSVEFNFDRVQSRIQVLATVKACERTGVEMEAMVAASVAALTIYDMCKAVDKAMTVEEICLLYKEGGKSGVFRREERG